MHSTYFLSQNVRRILKCPFWYLLKDLIFYDDVTHQKSGWSARLSTGNGICGKNPVNTKFTLEDHGTYYEVVQSLIGLDNIRSWNRGNAMAHIINVVVTESLL